MAVDQITQNQLIEVAQLRLAQRVSSAPLSRDDIAQVVDQLLSAFPEWRDITSRSQALAQLGTLFSTFVGEESILHADDGHTPWLEARRSDIRWQFWGRYRTHLIRRRIPQTAINALDRVTDRALELLGDPSSATPFDRRGMVVGDVQSGKTSNYTGLVCKAADAGYRVIIVLTGMNNNLRSQTQIRLDEGFIGKISVPLSDATTSRTTGVGEIDPSAIVDWATNRTENGDFNFRVMSQFGIHPGGRPLLLVVKKNASVLQGILEWIRVTGNARDEHGPRFTQMPLLVIDDEADQASIDTKPQGGNGPSSNAHKPSTINAKIRSILERFDQASYVGYTATPFANIFIHPDAETGKEFQDLFPRHFIINIPSPETYVGASRVFGAFTDDDEDDGVTPGLPSLIKRIDDHATSLERTEARGWMPPVHRSGHIPLHDGRDQPPPSLNKAIRCFALVVAARRARGQAGEHNSMLVHVTRFQAVQRRVLHQVQEAVDALVNEVRYGGDPALSTMQALWEEEFAPVIRDLNLADCPPVQWSEVQPALHASVGSIRVREINGTSADVLDYEQNKGSGLNVIAIGGDKLARGLTLEGLSISYFLRGSTMYDTLMQMGRWFGYRPGYLDLCRLFTTAELVLWYEHIAKASEELRREFDRMEALRQQPVEFGLKVRSHSTLTITSRAKMRHGTALKVSFAGDVSETTVFDTDERTLLANHAAASDLIDRLQGDGVRHTPTPEQPRGPGRVHRWNGSHLWTGANPQQILGFLDRFATHEDASRADAKTLARYIRRQNELGELVNWNVLLVGGEGDDVVPLGPVSVSSVIRQPKGGYGKPYKVFRPGERFDIRRLLNPRDEAVDISAEDYASAMEETLANPPKKRRADAESTPANPSGVYLRARRSPRTGLLLIYPLARAAEPESADGRRFRHEFLVAPVPPIGIGISFPASRRAQSVTYYVNAVYGAAGDDEGET
ncbi:MAG TPA: Z1 domain-containing protein [Longimicrobium sp.]|nr:Z1 domain-containing protein [Longimicrobium sp.]